MSIFGAEWSPLWIVLLAKLFTVFSCLHDFLTILLVHSVCVLRICEASGWEHHWQHTPNWEEFYEFPQFSAHKTALTQLLLSCFGLILSRNVYLVLFQVKSGGKMNNWYVILNYANLYPSAVLKHNFVGWAFWLYWQSNIPWDSTIPISFISQLFIVGILWKVVDIRPKADFLPMDGFIGHTRLAWS